jgi:Domain of unknown function (DUF4431)
MRSLAITFAAVVVVTLYSGPSAATDRTCLDYGPAVVTLTGTITRHVEYGPPGYGEDPIHDARERHWYLELDDPICVNGKVNGKNDASPEAEGEKDVRKLQIVYANGLPEGGDWINHRASITGTLFHAITGHHHTALLITAVKTVKALDAAARVSP